MPTDIFLKLLPSHSNWTTSIEKLMFDGDKMFVISTDKLRFASIMEQFSNYEIVVCYPMNVLLMFILLLSLRKTLILSLLMSL